MVEFSELAYHFRSPGDLSVDELDDVLQFLHTRVQRQEKTELSQLSRLYQALKRYNIFPDNALGFGSNSNWDRPFGTYDGQNSIEFCFGLSECNRVSIPQPRNI